MNAFLFVPLLALTWIFAFAMSIIASHYFLVVLEGTAAGNDKVELPEEPLLDWFWKPFYLAFLGIVWCAPGFPVAWRAGGENPALRLTLLVLWCWLLFPIGMLSSLSASSRWSPLWIGLFGRMAQRPKQVGQFYVLSLPVFGAMAVCFYMLTARPNTALGLILVLAPLAAAAYLVYARLLGRIGLVLSFTKGREDLRPRRRRPKPHPAIVTPVVQEATAGPVQPSQLPGIMTPYDGEITGYDVSDSDRPPPLPAVVTRSRVIPDDDDDGEMIRVVEPDPVPIERPLTLQQEQALKAPRKDELELYDHSERIVREPKRPFGAECFAFLVQPGPLQAWVRLSLGLLVLGALIFFMRELRPD
jgi:hypothetical protein